MWSPSPFWFDSEKFPVDAIWLAEPVTPAAKEATVKVIAAAAPAKNPTFAYVANNLLFPYMLTDEEPQLKPLMLRHDSVGDRCRCLRRREDGDGLILNLKSSVFSRFPTLLTR